MQAVFLAVVGGTLSASGANVMAWSEHQSTVAGVRWSQHTSILFTLACVSLNLIGIGCFVISCAIGGAVATVMPMQTAANLLANMFWQIVLGIKFYNKSMRVGTLVLVFAVGQLGDLGPKEPKELDAVRLLQRPAAIAWISALIVCTVAAVVASRCAMQTPHGSPSSCGALQAW